MEQQMIANGGLQIVPQIAVQYVYLDFDGESTSYNGEVLTIDEVEVKNSSLPEERIANILAELNAKYASQNVIFVTDKPETTEYSTIFIGKTEAFSPYGNFAGVAETIDKDNKISTDNAFVNLDSSATDAQIISTISHETDHLLGTINHGGEGLAQYAETITVGSHTRKYYYNLIYQGTLNSELHLFRNSVNYSSYPSADGKDYIYNHYVCGEKITLLSGGGFYGSNFKVTHVGGNTAYIDHINSEGIVQNISGLVTSGYNKFTVSGTATDLVLSGYWIGNQDDHYAYMTLLSGAAASAVTLANGGYMYISNGGVANNTVMNGGRMHVHAGGIANGTITNSYCGIYVNSGAVVNDTTINSGGSVYIKSGGVANDTTVNSCNSVYIESGGVANSVYLCNSGTVHVNSGVIGHVGSNSAYIDHINSEGIVQNVSGLITYGTTDFRVAGTATDIVLNNNMTLLSGATAANVTLAAGNMYIDGGVANNTVMNGGRMHVHAGGIANGTITNSYCGIYVNSGAVVNDTTINSGGSVYIKSGGVANDTTVNSCNSVYIESGGVANSVYLCNSGTVHVNSGVIGHVGSNSAYIDHINSEGVVQNISALVTYGYNKFTVSGTATDLVLSGYWIGNQDDHYAYMTLLSGAAASNICVNGGGCVFLSENTFMNSTFVNGGNVYISSGGATSNTTMSGGNMHIFLGGVANDTVMTDARMYVSEGGSAGNIILSGYRDHYASVTLLAGAVGNNISVNSAAYVYVYDGGVIRETSIASDGNVHVYSGGAASVTTVTDGGNLHISSGGMATDLIVDFGGINVSSGGTATNATIGSSCVISVDHGGVASCLTVMSGGHIYIYRGTIQHIGSNSAYIDKVNSDGTINNISGLVTHGRNVFSLTGTATDMVLSGYQNAENSVTLLSGAIAQNTAVNGGGSLFISSGGVASSTTLTSGGTVIFNEGFICHTGKNTAYVDKINADGTINNISGLMAYRGDKFSVTGTATDITLSGGYYNSLSSMTLLSGGTAVNTVINRDGRMYVSSGAAAEGTTNNNGGRVYVCGGNLTNCTNQWGGIYVSEGGVISNTVVAGGSVTLLSGAIAQNTAVNGGGSLFISSGGVASSTTLTSGGTVIFNEGFICHTGKNTAYVDKINADGTINNISGLMAYRGDKFSVTGTATDITLSGGYYNSLSSMTLLSGGTAVNTVINRDGRMYVSSGAAAEGTTNNNGGRVYVCGGNLTNCTNQWGGLIYVSEGGVISNTVVAGGSVFISGGGTLCGTMYISGGVVSAYSGSLIDFTVAECTNADDYLINDLSKISGTPTYTITVSATQTNGTYRLAQGAENFTGSITIGDAIEDYGSITVNGDDLVYNDITYSLDQADGNLTLTITEVDLIPPEKPIAIPSTTDPTNKDVTVSVTYSEDSTVKQYKIGENGEWVDYTQSFAVENNATIYFRAEDAAGNESTSSLVVANIDKTAPIQPLASVDVTAVTNKDVTITATFSEDSVIKHYKIGDGEWQNYVGAFSVSENGTIYFRAEDAAGNESSNELVISNIDKTSLAIPGGFNETVSGYNAKLDWSDASDTGVSGVKGYYVRYGLSDVLTGDGEFIAASEFDLTDLAVGTYFYQVKTEDKAGNISEWSAIQSFEIIPGAVQNLRGDSNGLSWDAIPGVEGYIVEYSTDNFANVISIETASNKIDSIALPAGTYQWRVKAVDGTTASNGENINSQQIAAGAQEFVSDKDGDTDVFFANASGTWDLNYAAQHLGILNSWSGTGEHITLTGKNKLADIFEGSSDSNILVITDDTNGDALFVDDIYTALPGTVAEQQACIAKIDEIRAGLGDDIVDMTSQRFEYVGDGVKIYGGLGNDTIWANNGSNTLFGDAGNDRIVGGKDNDVIVGGIGNDSMHGGGGEDIFCFGGNWGTDTVEQLSGGSVTLWFEDGSESNWNASTLTYTDGANSVKVSGVSDVTLKFGEAASQPSGCFDDAASEKIFEDKNKGFLA